MLKTSKYLGRETRVLELLNRRSLSCSKRPLGSTLKSTLRERRQENN